MEVYNTKDIHLIMGYLCLLWWPYFTHS